MADMINILGDGDSCEDDDLRDALKQLDEMKEPERLKPHMQTAR